MKLRPSQIILLSWKALPANSTPRDWASLVGARPEQANDGRGDSKITGAANRSRVIGSQHSVRGDIGRRGSSAISE